MAYKDYTKEANEHWKEIYGEEKSEFLDMRDEETSLADVKMYAFQQANPDLFKATYKHEYPEIITDCMECGKEISDKDNANWFAQAPSTDGICAFCYEKEVAARRARRAAASK